MLPLLHDRHVARQEGVAAGRSQGKELLPVLAQGPLGCTGGGGKALGILALVEQAAGVLVVVEDAAHAPGFLAVLQEEILVTPGLEHRVVGRIDAVAGVFKGLVEVLGVFKEGVVGGEVGAAAEPPHRTCLEVAVVEVNGGDIGAAGVQHHRGAGGKPALALGLGALAQDRRGQLVALHLGEVHTSLFKHPAAGHHPRTTAAALGPDPALFRKGGAAIEGLQAGADRILQTHQQGLGPGAGVGRGALQGQVRAGAGAASHRTGGDPTSEASHLGLGTGQQALQHQRHAPGALETSPPFQPTVPPHKPARRIVTPPRPATDP